MGGSLRAKSGENEGHFKPDHYRNIAPIYLACFSTERDDPALWREFAPGGVCLGIPVLTDEVLSDEHGRDLTRALCRVLYDEEEWLRTLRTQASEIVRRFVNLSRRERVSALETTLSALHRLGANLSLAAKRSDYQHQSEWRQVALPRPGYSLVPHEERDTKDRRFIALHMRTPPKKLVLREVLLAPRCPHTEGDVRQVLSEAGYADEEMPEISRSMGT
jgi:hypothetical protein